MYASPGSANARSTALRGLGLGHEIQVKQRLLGLSANVRGSHTESSETLALASPGSLAVDAASEEVGLVFGFFAVPVPAHEGGPRREVVACAGDVIGAALGQEHDRLGDALVVHVEARRGEIRVAAQDDGGRVDLRCAHAATASTDQHVECQTRIGGFTEGLEGSHRVTASTDLHRIELLVEHAARFAVLFEY